MSPVTPAGDRLRRVLALLPWLADRRAVPVREAAERFGVSPQRLVADLELVACCGTSPSPDDLIEVWIDDDDLIHLEVPKYFHEPPVLNAREGLALLTAGRTLLAVPGADPSGALAGALAKLEAALPDAGVEIDVAPPPLLDEVRAATEASRRMRIDYYSAWRDQRTTRVVEPLAVYFAGARWYVVADCHLAGGERRFRIDRIEDLEVLDECFDRRPVDVPLDEPFRAGPDAREVRLAIPADAQWVLESYPSTLVGEEPDGRLSVVLHVAGPAWLERLLLRLGPGAVVREPGELADVGRRAAQRLLRRYGADVSA